MLQGNASHRQPSVQRHAAPDRELDAAVVRPATRPCAPGPAAKATQNDDGHYSSVSQPTFQVARSCVPLRLDARHAPLMFTKMTLLANNPLTPNQGGMTHEKR